VNAVTATCVAADVIGVPAAVVESRAEEHNIARQQRCQPHGVRHLTLRISGARHI